MSSADDDAPETPFERTKRIMEAMIAYRDDSINHFDSTMLRNLKLLTVAVHPTDPTLSRLTYSLHVDPALCNGMGNLHGGMVATIFDVCTSFSVYPVCREGFWDAGHVTRTLNCVYLRPAAAGETVNVEAEVVHLGKTQAFLRGLMRNAKGKVLYTCEHNKANLAPKL